MFRPISPEIHKHLSTAPKAQNFKTITLNPSPDTTQPMPLKAYTLNFNPTPCIVKAL